MSFRSASDKSVLFNKVIIWLHMFFYKQIQKNKIMNEN